MKSKSWLRYFIYIFLIVLLMFLKRYLLTPIIEKESKTFLISPYHYLIPLIINAVIGFIVGFEHLISEIKNTGSWKINIPQVVLILIPSLYFSLTAMLYFIENEFVTNILLYPANQLIITGSTSFVAIFQIILGYTLITCFYKQRKY